MLICRFSHGPSPRVELLLANAATRQRCRLSRLHWLSPGGYISGRLTTPIKLPWPPLANDGIDYKHVIVGSYNVSLGTVATRQVNTSVSPDMDLATVRLAVPI